MADKLRQTLPEDGRTLPPQRGMGCLESCRESGYKRRKTQGDEGGQAVRTPAEEDRGKDQQVSLNLNQTSYAICLIEATSLPVGQGACGCQALDQEVRFQDSPQEEVTSHFMARVGLFCPLNDQDP